MTAPQPQPRSSQAPEAEAQAVLQRYARRGAQVDPGLYSLLNPSALAIHQERTRALAGMLRRQADLAAWRIAEIGCGAGGNLLDFIRLGADPAHLTGLELIAERAAAARAALPAAVQVLEGDALAADIAPGSLDLAAQFTVFSSLLDDAFQQRLAERMWQWLRPGGAVLWYDFAFDNPRNPDVRGVPVGRMRQLFPQGRVAELQRVTLAPPLARAACRLHPGLYGLLNLLPPLRTHRLAWIVKPE